MKIVTLKKDGKDVGRSWQTIAQARDFAREVLKGAEIFVNGSFWESVAKNDCYEDEKYPDVPF